MPLLLYIVNLQHPKGKIFYAQIFFKYFEEKIKTAVIWHKSTSKFKPDYSVDYLKDSPWIHMPFEKYETTNIKNFNFEK